MTGRFIVLEGLDGAGTTTQVACLAARLTAAGRTVLTTAEPSDLPLGRLIRETLKGHPDAPSRRALPWMFAADRADHLFRRVGPAIARGADVVSDRYLHSSLAYQSLELPMQDVHVLNQTFPTPHIVLFLRVPVDVALARIANRGQTTEIYEREEALRKVSKAYDQALLLRRSVGDRIEEIDGTTSPDTVADAVWALVGA